MARRRVTIEFDFAPPSEGVWESLETAQNMVEELVGELLVGEGGADWANAETLSCKVEDVEDSFDRMSTLPLPYNLTKSELVPESGPHPPSGESLQWLHDEAQAEELERIFRSTVLLMHHAGCNFAAALSTAIVWERG